MLMMVDLLAGLHSVAVREVSTVRLREYRNRNPSVMTTCLSSVGSPSFSDPRPEAVRDRHGLPAAMTPSRWESKLGAAQMFM